MEARSITVGSSTPWGEADFVDIKGNGIVWVATNSHGGFYVPPHLNSKIRAEWRGASFNHQGQVGWYEEDCDWCMVALTFREIFDAGEIEGAQSTFDFWIKPKLEETQR